MHFGVRNNSLQKWFAILTLLMVPALASAQSNKKPAAAPAAKAAPAARPAAPASRPQAPAARPAARPAAPGSKPATGATPGHPSSTTKTPGGHNPPTTTGAKPAGGKASPTAGGKPSSTVKPATPAKVPGTTKRPDGGKTVTRANGSTANFNKSGKQTSVTTPSGKTANFNSHGTVSSIHSGGMTINKGPGGSRRVETVNKNGTRLVSTGRRGGYAEHSFSRGGHSYVRRTYVYNGHAYARVYGRYSYGGYYYNGYVPGYYYGPAYYGWAYNPWPGPVYYGWGWGGAPWYGYYGYYYQPYPVYPYASLWLTDYLIAQNLQLAYEAQAAAAAESGQAYGAQFVTAAYHPGGNDPFGADKTAPVLTPELKQALADEVKAMIAAEKQAAASNQSAIPSGDQPPGALDPNFRVFVVSSTLTEQTADGTECSLSQGDFITRLEDTPDADKNVKVKVSSSQKDDCAAGTQLSVSVDDLQDMYNNFHQQIDDGLKSLSENQGKNGLPAAPATGGHAVAEGQAQPDLTTQTDLEAQQKDADKAEAEVQQSAKGPDNN
jgi:hypothetical protein